MPRQISFALTTPQFKNGTKTVTRRMGWLFLKPGDILMAVEKSQGLGKGGKVKTLGLIRVLEVRRESLGRLVTDLTYGWTETALEGFPVGTIKSDPFKFIQWFREGHRGCENDSIVTRIAFEKC